ncbi:preprotein translocase subunit SecA, partial [Candidatus Aminicenantes bacterium AC-335-G13]|nr:preprotein translocase subunit SecA [Candidatus Aminicenantes bacterium AC-335-G13]
TERHEARRIDNQLRGRAGRQGDPGSSRFYLSLEDDLMRIFGSDRIKNLMAKIGMQEGVPIEHKMVTKAIERAQKQVEAQNFSIRKHLLEYDDVMNKQRETIYRMRREILEGKNLKEQIQQLIEELVDWILDIHADPRKDPEEWDKEGLRKALITQFIFDINELNIDWENIEHGELRDLILSHLKKIYMEKEEIIGSDQMREFERLIMLQVIDSQWKDHLLAMDYLKEGIGLRGYGQRDPLVEYKKESFEMFQSMLNRIEEETIRYLFMLQPVVEEERVVREIPHAVYHRPVFNPFSQPSPQAEAVSSVPSSGSTRLREVRAVIPSKKRRRK